MRRTSLAALVAAVLLQGVAPIAPVMAGASLSVGDRAPEFDIAKDARGKGWKLKARRGKWTLMSFGASWCAPCAKELPVWDKLATEFAGRIEFVTVNVNNEPKDGAKFLDKLKVKRLTRVFLPARTSAVDDRYETGTFPSTFVIDPNGIVRLVHLGFHDGDDATLRASLNKLLPKAKR